MPSAGLSLQRAIYAALSGDAALGAALGGPRIHDAPPPGAPFPYVTFGQSTERDWSTGSDDGREHILTLHVWSQARGRSEAHEILGLLRTALHEVALNLDGWRLVGLRHELTELRRDVDGESWRGLARFRAVTEPA